MSLFDFNFGLTLLQYPSSRWHAVRGGGLINYRLIACQSFRACSRPAAVDVTWSTCSGKAVTRIMLSLKHAWWQLNSRFLLLHFPRSWCNRVSPKALRPPSGASTGWWLSLSTFSCNLLNIDVCSYFSCNWTAVSSSRVTNLRCYVRTRLKGGPFCGKSTSRIEVVEVVIDRNL